MEKRFFKPFVGTNYNKGINGKKVLVLGASFYCNQKSCRYFEECTDVVRKDSSAFAAKCTAVDYNLTEEPSSAIESQCDDGSYKIFANEMKKYTGTETSADTWSYFAFTNYVQFFVPSEKEGMARVTMESDMSERDYDAFNETLRELEPDVVIVWGSVISGRIMQDNIYLVDMMDIETSDGYMCRIKLPEMKKEITLINSHHPSSSDWHSNIKQLEFYLRKVIDDVNLEPISKEAAYIIDRYVKNIFIRDIRDGDEMDRRIYGFRHSSDVNYDDYDPISSYEKFVVSLYGMTPDADSEILKVLEEYRIDLSKTFHKDEIDVLLKEYKAVIRYCSDRDYLWWSSKSLSYMLPDKLMELCLTIVKSYCGSTVTDLGYRLFGKQSVLPGTSRNLRTGGICGDVLLPFANDAQFIPNLRNCSPDICESDAKIWAFSQILRDAFLLDDIIHSGTPTDVSDGKMYDYVFSCPVGRKDFKAVADELYNVAYTRLKEGGVMCCVLPEGFCYEPEWYDLRKILVDKGRQYFALVISLPDLMQPYVMGNLCLFCLLKLNSDSFLDSDVRTLGDNVTVMNAKSSNFLILDVEQRSDFFPGDNNNNDNRFRLFLHGLWRYNFMVQPVLNSLSLRDIKYVRGLNSYIDNLTENVNLLPTRYLLDNDFPSDNEKFVRLEEIIELVTPAAHKSNNDEEQVQRLTNVDLTTDYLNCNISYSDTLKTKRRGVGNSKTLGDGLRQMGSIDVLARSINHDPDRLTGKCLLASYCKGRFKVGRIVDSSESCSFELDPEVIPFKLKSDIVSEDFLLSSLLSDEVLMQAMAISWAGFYDGIDKADFLQIGIWVPSKKEQERQRNNDAEQFLMKMAKNYKKPPTVS